MFVIPLIVGLVFQFTITASEFQAETITDLYNKINDYGSLIKATSFEETTQAKLKHINTVRMVSLPQVPYGILSFGIRIKSHSNERIALIELRLNSPNVYVRLARYGRRKYRLHRLSPSSYDLTRFATHFRRLHIFISNRSFRQANINPTIFYYSSSNTSLFSSSTIPTNASIKRRFRRTIPSTSSTCAKHEYQIDFDQFSFGQWILQPKRFDAYTCSGSCPNPLSPQYFPSNHAILLSLMRSQHDSGQQSSCVPVKLKPLCLLYYDRDELVIKYHRDMIVQECGCR